MTVKKYTAEQLRIAREIVDQEEAVSAERKVREQRKRAAKVASVGKRIKSSRSIVTKEDKSITKPVRRSLIGLFIFWALNGYLHLYALSSDTSLYRTVLIWAIPLAWLGFVWFRWVNEDKPKMRPHAMPTQGQTKSKQAQDQEYVQTLGMALVGLGILVLILFIMFYKHS